MTDYRCDGCGGPLPADEATAYCDSCERIGNAAEDARAIADRAAEARHGGRYITGALARAIDNPAIRARFAGEGGPEALAEIWRYTASPSGSNYPASGRDTTARAARDAAAIGGVTWAHSAYWRAPMLPEAAFSWPLYVAGIGWAMATDRWPSDG